MHSVVGESNAVAVVSDVEEDADGREVQKKQNMPKEKYDDETLQTLLQCMGELGYTTTKQVKKKCS